jgi:hypothetical protein
MNTALRQPISDEQRREWAQRNELERQQRALYRTQRLAEFSTSELWEECHNRMTEANRQWWRSQGIPDDWQDWWHFGYIAQRTFRHGDQTFVSPAYTIPIFDLGWAPVNMQYRIETPPEGVGKYRQEFGLPAAAFLSRPDQELGGELIVVEGAKKAAVVSLALDAMQVVGIPGASSWAGIDERLKGSERVYVILDPDAEAQARKLTVALGKVARLITLPTKPDDAILYHDATGQDFRRLMRQAKAV